MKTKTIMAGLLLAGVALSDTPPPTIVTPPIVTVTTQTVQVVQTTVSTNATLRQFTVYIDREQNPERFLSVFSDRSYTITEANRVPAMGNRQAIETFNQLLSSVVSSGTHYAANTNAPGR